MDEITQKELQTWIEKSKNHSVKEIWIKDHLSNLWSFFKDEEGSNFSEKVFLFKNRKGTCKSCGKSTTFLSYARGYRDFCSKSCSNSFGELLEKKLESFKVNNLEKWGVDNPSKLQEVKEKIKDSKKDLDYKEIYEKSKQTTKKNWGVENPSQSEVIKQKKGATNLEKRGTQNPFQSEEVKEKIKNTHLNNLGVEHPLKSEKVKGKMRSNNIAKWGFDNYTKTETYKKLMFEKWRDGHIPSNLEKDPNYGTYLGSGYWEMNCDLGLLHTYKTTSHLYHARKRCNITQCTACFPVSETASFKEKELFDFIESKYQKDIIRNYRDVLEIDIYLPDMDLGFEFNGLYWHSELFKEKNYHLDKMDYFEKKGIRIINIWEDDWENKTDIIKSQILNWIGLTPNKIWARKCVVKQVKDVGQIRSFLDRNHIQGFTTSTLKLGLYYGDNLVSLMTFDHFEGRRSMSDDQWNLSRFCNILNTTVVGGASKLLNYFIENWSPKRIISFADKAWSGGHLYKSLGFHLQSQSLPNYTYLIDGKRSNKQKWTKSKLTKMGYDPKLSESRIMEENFGAPKIFDLGQMKFQLFPYPNP